MKSFSWRILTGLFWVVLSAVVYFIYFLIFRDAHHIFVYLVGDKGIGCRSEWGGLLGSSGNRG
jgi:hypothetical protein